MDLEKLLERERKRREEAEARAQVIISAGRDMTFDEFEQACADAVAMVRSRMLSGKIKVD